MKSKTIRDKTFNTNITFVWNCPLPELDKYIANRLDYNIELDNSIGKTIMGKDNVFIWVKNKRDYSTIAHEILHAIRFLLQDYYDIDLNEDTEEIYTKLHSFYMEEILKVIK